MTEDGNYDAMVTGTLHAIYVSKRGPELIVDVDPQPGSTTESSQLTCRLDRSVSHGDNMLRLAENALLHGLTVSLFGYGDDGDDTMEYHEIRILSKQ